MRILLYDYQNSEVIHSSVIKYTFNVVIMIMYKSPWTYIVFARYLRNTDKTVNILCSALKQSTTYVSEVYK